MLKTTLLALLLSATTAHAQGEAGTTWFTVIGDPADARLDTVQVDPVDRDGDAKTMRVRVSRAAPRTSWDGLPYRSYTANVAFECERKQARYLVITYYTQPGWHGEPGQPVDYSVGTPRMMEFRDVMPNPTQRIIHAACSLAAKR